MTGGSAAAAVSDRPLAVRFERLAGCLSLELSCSSGEADLHGKQSPFAVHPMGCPAGCRGDYQSGVKTRGLPYPRSRRPP